MRTATLTILCASCLATSAHAQINWHAPAAAGKVWGDKIDENNREARNRTPEQQAQAEAADAAWEAPLSQADMTATRERNRAEYNSKLRLGQGHADRWLDHTARMERFKRAEGIPLASRQIASEPRAATNCSTRSLPLSERRRMESEYGSRFTKDGKASADAWAHEQGRRFRAKLVAEGQC